jgi:hypothetical protein
METEKVGVIMATGAGGAIPRDDYWRMDAHAKRYYDEIRKRKGDVERIAKNTGFSIRDVQNIKNHVFHNQYHLGVGDDEPRHFDPSYDMAVSWQRLIDGKDIQEMDIVMLRHELKEWYLMTQCGLPYREAHEQTNTFYNYERFVTELDRKAGLR